MATWTRPNPHSRRNSSGLATATTSLPPFSFRLRFSLTLPFPPFRLAASASDSDPLLRFRRQATTEEAKKEESFEKELCKDKDAGEWFRLVAGEGDNCRDVIQCTSSVS